MLVEFGQHARYWYTVKSFLEIDQQNNSLKSSSFSFRQSGQHPVQVSGGVLLWKKTFLCFINDIMFSTKQNQSFLQYTFKDFPKVGRDCEWLVGGCTQMCPCLVS